MVYPEYNSVSFVQGMCVQIYAQLDTFFKLAKFTLWGTSNYCYFNQVYTIVFTYAAILLYDPV